MHSTRSRVTRRAALAVVAALGLVVPGLVAGLAAPAGATPPPAAAGGFTGVVPYRLLDSRSDGGCLNGTRNVTVAGVAGSGVPADAAAVALNVTAVSPSLPGFLTVWPAGVSRPTASTVNYVAGQVVPNNAIVKVGASQQVSVFASGGCPQVVVDVVGWFASGTPAVGGLTGLTPFRVLDTRLGGQGPCINGSRSLTIAGVAGSGVPTDAAAVALNVTVVSPGSAGFLTVSPTGVPRPNASTLNYRAGQVVANGTVVKLGTGGRIDLYANAGCPNVLVDVVGAFATGSPTAAGGFDGVTPYRLLDTRTNGGCLNGSRSLTVAGVLGSAMPSDTAAVALNVTVVNPSIPGYLTVSPTGSPRPTASNLNYVAGDVVPNGVLVKVGTNQRVDLFASGGCPDVVVDLVGGFTMAPVDLTTGCSAGESLTGCAYLGLGSLPPAGWSLGAAQDGALSSTGRYLAFTADDQVFRRDLVTGTTVLVSTNTVGQPGNDVSDSPAISADGRYVAFESDADDLIASDTNASTDVFLRDVQAGTTTRVSVAPNGAESDGTSHSPSISADGNRIAFLSDASNLSDKHDAFGDDAYVRDRSGNTTIMASPRPFVLDAPEGPTEAVISADGTKVAITTADRLLVADTNDTDDVYVRDLTNGGYRYVSRKQNGTAVTAGGSQPAISADGRYVAFASAATDLDGAPDANGTLDVFVSDGTTDAITRVSVTGSGAAPNSVNAVPTISGDGRYVAYLTLASDVVAGDTNGAADVIVRDRVAGRSWRASVTATGGQLAAGAEAPTMSADGAYVGFLTIAAATAQDADTSADLYVRAVPQPTIASVSPASLAAGASTTVTVTGAGFLAGALPRVGGDGATVSNVSLPNETTMTFTLTLAPGAPSGKRDVWVRVPGTGIGTATGASAGCTGCITVP